MPKKMRLDQILVDRGLVESRTRAQALVMAGLVFTGEQKLAKPGQQCRVYGVDGSFIAIMSFDPSAGRWKPDRVFHPGQNASGPREPSPVALS